MYAVYCVCRGKTKIATLDDKAVLAFFWQTLRPTVSKTGGSGEGKRTQSPLNENAGECQVLRNREIKPFADGKGNVIEDRHSPSGSVNPHVGAFYMDRPVRLEGDRLPRCLPCVRAAQIARIIEIEV